MCLAQTGEWSKDEHQRFLDALDRYGLENSGREFALISKHVRTRSEEDTRLHAQEYFVALQGSRDPTLGKGAPAADAASNGVGTRGAAFSSVKVSGVRAVAGTQNPPSNTSQPGGPSASHAASSGMVPPLRARQDLQNRQQQGGSPHSVGVSPVDSPTWTQGEDTIFETLLAEYDESVTNRWDKIAAAIPHKTADDVRRRYVHCRCGSATPSPLASYRCYASGIKHFCLMWHV